MEGLRQEKIKSINWKHYFILKALFSSETKELTTPELIEKLKFYFKLYNINLSNYECTRTLLNRQLGVLIDVGLITKFVGATNRYEINSNYESICYSLIVGFFGLLDLKEVK